MWKIKKDYFKIKSFVRQQIIGKHVLPTQKTFSTGLLRIATLLKRSGYSVEYFHLEDFLSIVSKPILISLNPAFSKAVIVFSVINSALISHDRIYL